MTEVKHVARIPGLCLECVTTVQAFFVTTGSEFNRHSTELMKHGDCLAKKFAEGMNPGISGIYGLLRIKI
jgi:hypothetical protein